MTLDISVYTGYSTQVGLILVDVMIMGADSKSKLEFETVGMMKAGIKVWFALHVYV
jgi:hypothetical protein